MHLCRILTGAFVLVALTRRASSAQLEQVDELVRSEMAKRNAPGVAIAIVSKGQVLAAKGYGLANVEHNVPVTEHTIFQSGSVGKQFTATAVMILVEDGKIGLEDSVTKYFRDAPASWRPITVRHLLTHTSGIPNYTLTLSTATLDLQRNYTEDELVKMAYGLPLEFAPGARWNYSNTGYALLGILVRKASGRFYGDVLQERVFAPLGMKTARVISEADIVPNRAAGYRTVNGELKNQEWVAPENNTTADGALYLTVLDLIAWDKGLRSKAILKPESWEQVFKPVTLNSGKTYPYGFGWFLDEVGGEPMQWHGGSWQGFRARIVRYVGRDLTIIFLANHADFGGIAEAIAGRIDPRLAVPELKPIADTDPAVTARLKGLLAAGSQGRLSPTDFLHMQAGWLPADGYANLLKPLGALERLDLLQRRELGDDRVYVYDAVFATQTLRVEFGLAPDDGISLFAVDTE